MQRVARTLETLDRLPELLGTHETLFEHQPLQCSVDC